MCRYGQWVRVPFLGEPAGLANGSQSNAGQNAQDDCSDYDYAEIGHGSAPVDAPPTFHFSASGTAFQEKGRAYAGVFFFTTQNRIRSVAVVTWVRVR